MRYKRTIDCIGYSFVPNHTATMEALARAKLSGREFRIVLFIMRQTNGYLREEDQISPGYFESKTGIDKAHLSNVLGRLKKLNIVSVALANPPFYSVNPPQRWDPTVFTKNGEDDSPNLVRNFTKNGEKQLHPIDNLKKTNYRDRSISLFNNKSTGETPDPCNKYTRGKYGHMVISSPGDLERIRGGDEHGDTEHTSSEESGPDAGAG